MSLRWVGGTDLEVEFMVTDGATAVPIEGAEVAIQSYGGLYHDEERDAAPFVLRTDAEGAARRVCHRTTTSGQDSGLGLTRTFTAALPEWRFRVSASGYEEAPEAWVWTAERGQAVRRTGPGRSKVVVPVALSPKGTP